MDNGRSLWKMITASSEEKAETNEKPMKKKKLFETW